MVLPDFNYFQESQCIGDNHIHCAFRFFMSSRVNQNVINSLYIYIFEKYLRILKGNTIWMIIIFPRTVGTDKLRSMAMKISLNTYCRMKMASGVKRSTWRSPFLKSIAI